MYTELRSESYSEIIDLFLFSNLTSIHNTLQTCVEVIEVR